MTLRARYSALLVISFSLTSTAIAEKLPDPGVTELADLEYMREVLMYCGISDPIAVKGFLDRKGSIMAKHEMNRDEELQAGSMARQRSYAEWQNRGLGGFKGWCRKEGADYTETLKTFAVK